MKLRTPTLLTFDAFGTLFTPRQPIAKQYGSVARSHGLHDITDDDIASSFQKALENESRRRPNYGRKVGMKASEWWANVISATFQPYISKNSELPQGLVPALLTRFSSRRGYRLFPDVIPFFRNLKEAKQKLQGNVSAPLVGVLTNSDDRVSSILSSFSLSVGAWRYGTDLTRQQRSNGSQIDFDFVALSYDVGVSKPDPQIFNATRDMVQMSMGQDLRCIHVGDEPEKDYHAALNAGWESVLLDRGEAHTDRGISRISNLTELGRFLEA